jgi:hypothetical protein
MSFATEKQVNDDLAMYSRLDREKVKIVNTTSAWMSSATTLHNGVDAEKQVEVQTMRDALVADLTAILT